jgi:hypothetical protein
MVRIANVVGVLGLAGAMWVIALAESAAQQPYDYGNVVYEAVRNKIGLMRYCRNNALLNVSIADRAVAAVRYGLLKMVLGTGFAKERGDLAEKAGEDGYWEANRRRHMASIAKLFGTTPAGLCQEWAQETLRKRQPGRSRNVMPVSPGSPPRVSPHNANRRRVIPRQVQKPGDKPPAPPKAAEVPARAAVGEATKAPEVVKAPEVTKPQEAPPPPVAAAPEEEPTVNWGTGPIVIWTTKVRTQTRPTPEQTGGTAGQTQQNQKRD